MKIQIQFDMDNAAFEDARGAETARILRAIAMRVERGFTEGRCIDANGNGVGEWTIITEASDD